MIKCFSYRISFAVLISFYCLVVQSDCLAATLQVYGYGMEDPQELAFDSIGNLYAGHSRNAYGMSIYQIPPGGGEAVAWPSTASPFDDPDGLDVDSLDRVWGTTGVFSNVQNGEVIRVSSDGTAEAIGQDYLGNPTSLEIDRNGRFGPAGSVLVANLSNAVSGVEILSVNPDPFSVDNIFSTGAYNAIRCLSFDSDNTLWFLGGGKLYRWTEQADQPQEFELSGITGDISAIGVDPFVDGLVVGLIDERAVGRVYDDGIVDIIATGLDPRAFAFDSQGRIYISDQVSDVVWVIPEPSTLFLLALGGFIVTKRRQARSA